MKHEHSAEDVLRKRASDAGALIRTEFDAPDGIFAYFASMPPEAELEYLRLTLDDVAAGPDTLRREAQATADGDVSPIERKTANMKMQYPALYDALVAARNRAWLPRMDTMITSRARGFIVVGSGHLVGEDGLLRLLESDGYTVATGN